MASMLCKYSGNHRKAGRRNIDVAFGPAAFQPVVEIVTQAACLPPVVTQRLVVIAEGVYREHLEVMATLSDSGVEAR